MDTGTEKIITPVTVGTKVPDFIAPVGENRTLQFSSLAGKKVVLYFYPKDNTPGCTLESMEFAALREAFGAAGAVILGASRDGLRSHASFQAQCSLPFDLISDPDETLCKLFDVIRDKVLYGRETRGINRSTFLIDGAGILRQEWRDVRAGGHAAEVLAAVQSL